MSIENSPEQAQLASLKGRIKILLGVSSVAGLIALYPLTQLGTQEVVGALVLLPLAYLAGIGSTIFMAVTTVRARRLAASLAVSSDPLLAFAHAIWILGVVLGALAALPMLFIMFIIGSSASSLSM